MKQLSLVLILVLLVIVVISIKTTPKQVKFYQCNTYPVNKSLTDIFQRQGINRTLHPDNADIYLACGYTNIEKEYSKIPIDKQKYIHAIKGCDNIVSKNKLWSLLKDYYGIDIAQHYVPNTFLLNDYKDKLRLLKTNSLQNNKIFIIKKNLQRQEGLKFIRQNDLNISKLNELSKQNYVIAQEYLDNPFTVNERKINLRVYLLIVIENGIKYAYIYKNGFIYYTKKHYKYSTDPNEGVTTGYIDRQVYIDNPLTHNDLKNFMKKNGDDYKLLFSNIQTLIVKVLDGVSSSFQSTNGKVNYQLFGLDIQPDKNLNVKLIEINKGASLQEMDESDAKIKKKLQEDIYKTINIIKENNDNEFVLIWKK